MNKYTEIAATMREMAAELESTSGEWIAWHAEFIIPVPPKTLVDVRFRNGEIEYDKWTEDLCWTHEGDSADIVAYRLVQPVSQPKTVAICCDTIKRQAAELANVKAQLANVKRENADLRFQVGSVNSLAISRGRENEQLRAKNANLATAADYWRNTAMQQADAMERIAERDAVIVELRKQIARMQAKASDGWIACSGGECPIKDGRTLVDVKFRSGKMVYAQPARDWNWKDYNRPDGLDIVAYRIVTVAPNTFQQDGVR